ncbi:hypothetical protein CONCODRAFT_14272, partial [Conidiobolus coronatus NRRL 28638]
MAKNSCSFETISMKFGGHSLEKRSSNLNLYYLGAIEKTSNYSFLDMIPILSKDLKQLEKGIKMWSAIEKGIVLVKAPLLWVEGDHKALSELLGLKPSTARYPCRKCYINLNSTARGLNDLEYYTQQYSLRYKECFLDVQRCPENNIYVRDINGILKSNTPDWYGFNIPLKCNLLELESFDPTFDTPIEILHTLGLGICKIIIEDCS